MNKKHPAYLVRQANGMFAFQIYIPAPLRAQGTPASICRSLRTNVRRDAQALSRSRAKASHQLFDDVHAGRLAREALPGRIRTFVEEALRASAVASNADDALAAFTADLNAMWDAPPSLFVPREQEAEHPHVHVVLLNNASEPAYRRRFQAFEHGPVQPHRVHRWTVLSHVLSPEHSDPGRRLDFGDLFDSL